MAAPLKDRLGVDAIEKIADELQAAGADLDRRAFLRTANDGLEQRELMDRARQVALAMEQELPPVDEALDIFVRALGPTLDDGGVGSLRYFVHSQWLSARAPRADFDLAMGAAEELTRRFTSEFAVRPLIERDPERALAWLQAWARSDNEHVRRLVSEGTRPRLPWGTRLSVFEDGYEPISELLDELADDASLYVRRSVANHVGDLAKDDLPLALQLCRGFRARARPELEWVIKHALRHPLKRGEASALALMGQDDVGLTASVSVKPARVPKGGEVKVDVKIANDKRRQLRGRVDLVVHFVKASGATSAKVFRLANADVSAKSSVVMSKRLRLGDLSTRKHYAGDHRVDARVNGRDLATTSFTLTDG